MRYTIETVPGTWDPPGALRPSPIATLLGRRSPRPCSFGGTRPQEFACRRIVGHMGGIGKFDARQPSDWRIGRFVSLGNG